MKLIITLLSLIFVTSCASFVNKIEISHAKKIFTKLEAIESEVSIRFGGRDYLKAKLTFSTDSGKGKLEYSDGRIVIFNGDRVYYSPNVKNQNAIRFDAYTWVYFQLLAYKLRDQGVMLEDYNESKLNDIYETKKLSFKAGTGDAPQDWYVLYRNKETSLIDAAAYIVTFGKTKKEAQKDPHAIKYHNYKLINGVPIAQKWSFWGWTSKDEFKSQIGEATLAHTKFIKVDENTFQPGKNFILYK